ncbi:MAG: ABC transporter ATP-binding protein, partial [Acidimicrobiia bacterium]|nr:ABC transporter ATP-binding protein [Acidimicrobiia bacterium]
MSTAELHRPRYEAQRAEPPPNLWRLAWRVSQHEPRSFWLGWILFVLFFAAPAITGFILAKGFAELQAGNQAGVYRWALLSIVVETGRMVTIHAGALLWTRCWVHMQTFLRGNLLVAQMASGGPEAGQPVGSAGEAITHFRDDAEDVAQFVDGIVDVSAGLVFTVIAGFLLGAADATGAAVLLLPLLAVALMTRTLDSRIKAYRAADRVATAAVTGLVGDVMAAATTVKVNDSSEHLLARLRTLVDERRRTAVRDRVLDEGVQAFSRGAADIGLGLVLLVSAGAIASGEFGLGVLALFVSYLGWLSFLPRMVGRVLARRKQAGVAFDRMRLLVADAAVGNTVRRRILPLEPWQRGVRPAEGRPQRVPLQRLDVVGLTARHHSGRGVADVSLTIRRGEFVVVTGPVGSGKSTLLRAILGLAWQADVAGDVRWNGDVLDDRAAFLVPPNAAFLPQVPQLVSDSVRDNVGLGPITDESLARALALAAVDGDIAGMPAGEDTLIGPRGLRLSGGQRQRLATARALVHAPELVVLDDLSSAVDVETELQLWHNLAAAGLTV